MAKDIRFNVKLTVDGKEQLVTATTATTELSKAFSATRSEVSGLNDSLVNFNQYVEKVQNVSNAVSQLAGTLSSLTQESRQYADAMAAANTMAGKSGKDFEQLTDQVSELAKTIPMARDLLAKGLYQVVSNGVPEDNWLSYLEASAKASIGGIADLEEVVKVTSTVIKNYGLSWEDAESIQDKIQLTAKNGVTSFEQLAQALPRVTANAATLGVSVDDLMATFATLTGVSGNTAEVSTQLAAVFTALIKPSSEATKMAEAMGIQFDAAAIKAAGGFREFLTELDKTVKEYSTKSGMLEQTIYGKLFGSAESLRALVPLTGKLADKFDANAQDMANSAGTINGAFGEMAETVKAKMQLLENKFAGIGDALQGFTKGAQPLLNFTSQAGNTIVSVFALHKAMSALGATALMTGTRFKVANTAAVLWNATSVRMNALVKLVSASFRGAAVSAQTLKLAFQGLAISTGVGVAVVALSEAFTALTSSAGKASDSLSDLSEEEQKAKADREQELKQRQDIVASVNLNIAKLKEFKGSKEEERKLVKEMNDTYGDALGYYSSVSQWYTALVGNSKDYCNQLINEIRIQKMAQEAAELRQQAHDVRYDKNGKTRRYSKEKPIENVQIDDVGGILKVTSSTGASDLDKAQKRYNELTAQASAKEKQMAKLVQSNQKTYKQFDGYSSGKPSAVPTVTTTTPRTSKGGSSTAGSTEASALKGSVDWYEAKLQTLKKQITASSDETVAKSLQADYEKAEAELDQLKQRIGLIKPDPVEVKVKTHLDELEEQLEEAKKEFDNATTIDAKVKADAKVSDIQKQIDQATNGKVTISAVTTPSYIVSGSADDIRQSYSNAQSRASQIQSDFEIGLIGKDEAERQIDKLNEEISGLYGNLKPIKLDVDHKGFDAAMENIQKGWSGISGIGNGIQSITDALDSDSSAWQKASSVISGFLSIAEGISGIVNLINTLTGATQAHTVAATADAVASTTEATASTAATAAKSGEAVADATSAGAKLPFPANIAAIAAGVAAVVAALAMVSKFATGGVVGGSSTSGDKKFVRVNSGEMILNKQQQARLFGLIEGRFNPPTFYEHSFPTVTAQSLANGIEPTTTEVNINLNANARKMLDLMFDTRRVAAKSGKRYNS